MCDLVDTKKAIYLSAHIFGKAGDFTVLGMDIKAVWAKIEENKALLPYPIRIENTASTGPVTWLHFDVLDYAQNGQKITYIAG